ncbi:PIN domain-containing protein [Sphingobium sp.]|uniref:PIN domain-containing protein n=1 Tax=Sphingobium sp. TaxID=1912891 RepID=UPI0028BE2F42|nr:PIN domain-containing protein [Sphingobium sp.]
MFANRYTAFIDACTLASVLRRNLLLTLAEAEFFRIRWSAPVLEETGRAIAKMLSHKGRPIGEAEALAATQIARMRQAFGDAEVVDFGHLMPLAATLPDSGDAHVIAAAVKTQAAAIVTENLKDFPDALVASLNLEARSSDDFIADTTALYTGRAVAAIRRMRERFRRPEKSAHDLLLDIEAAGLVATVDALRPHVGSL